MANSYQIIDEKTWERTMHCMVFRNSVEPAFCVTFEADITNFKRMVKEHGLSFTLAMVYAVCKCANKIEAFRYRFVDGQVVLYDRIDTAFTYLNKETNLFKEAHICLYRDKTEIILLQAQTKNIFPNRELYGYGYDAYLYTDDQEKLEKEFLEKGVKIVKPLNVTDYKNKEFVIEDIDGRWIAFGLKIKD